MLSSATRYESISVIRRRAKIDEREKDDEHMHGGRSQYFISRRGARFEIQHPALVFHQAALGGRHTGIRPVYVSFLTVIQFSLDLSTPESPRAVESPYGILGYFTVLGSRATFLTCPKINSDVNRRVYNRGGFSARRCYLTRIDLLY